MPKQRQQRISDSGNRTRDRNGDQIRQMFNLACESTYSKDQLKFISKSFSLPCKIDPSRETQNTLLKKLVRTIKGAQFPNDCIECGRKHETEDCPWDLELQMLLRNHRVNGEKISMQVLKLRRRVEVTHAKEVAEGRLPEDFYTY